VNRPQVEPNGHNPLGPQADSHNRTYPLGPQVQPEGERTTGGRTNPLGQGGATTPPSPPMDGNHMACGICLRRKQIILSGFP
jgi:hypothetical protein